MKCWQIVTLVGAGLLMLGVFVPIISVPVVGSVNYFRRGEGDGVIVLCIGAGVLAFIDKRKPVPWGGLLSLLLIAYSFQAVWRGIQEAKRSMSTQLAGNPFAGIGQAMIESVQFEWGWVVLSAGALSLISTWFIKDQPYAHVAGAFPVERLGPGRYKIIGVDRETKMDTTWHCSADSTDNAKVKAELEGIIVTSIEADYPGTATPTPPVKTPLGKPRAKNLNFNDNWPKIQP